MDPIRFDSLVKSLSTASTRRGLVRLLAALPVAGGLLSLLDAGAEGQGNSAVVGGGGRRRRRRIRNRRRSGSRQKPDKDKDNRKGKRKRKGTDSTPSGPQCTATGATCTTDAQCCGGTCNAGGSTTGPLANTADECVVSCRSGRATCDPNRNPEEQCCGERGCVNNPATGPGEVCSSFTGEQCIADPAATATAPSQGTCESSSNICPGDGNVGPTGVCCRASGQTSTFVCPNSTGCCTGECMGDNCCAPNDQNPTESGGPVCAGGTSAGCCSGLCTGTTADDSRCIGGI